MKIKQTSDCSLFSHFVDFGLPFTHPRDRPITAIKLPSQLESIQLKQDCSKWLNENNPNWSTDHNVNIGLTIWLQPNKTNIGSTGLGLWEEEEGIHYKNRSTVYWKSSTPVLVSAAMPSQYHETRLRNPKFVTLRRTRDVASAERCCLTGLLSTITRHLPKFNRTSSTTNEWFQCTCLAVSWSNPKPC